METTFEEAKQMATKYAIDHSYDIVFFVAEREIFFYFRLYKSTNSGKKTGLPLFLKIPKDGSELQLTMTTEDSMWAYKQEGKLKTVRNLL